MKISIYIIWLVIAVIIQLCLLASSTRPVYDPELGTKEIGMIPFYFGILLNGLMFLIFWLSDEKKPISKKNN